MYHIYTSLKHLQGQALHCLPEQPFHCLTTLWIMNSLWWYNLNLPLCILRLYSTCHLRRDCFLFVHFIAILSTPHAEISLNLLEIVPIFSYISQEKMLRFSSFVVSSVLMRLVSKNNFKCKWKLAMHGATTKNDCKTGNRKYLAV